VVGLSWDGGGLVTRLRAFLWENGLMLDLNDLVQPEYRGHLRSARGINDAGWITGQSMDPATGERRAFLAIPRE
jgi:hypothetical protein